MKNKFHRQLSSLALLATALVVASSSLQAQALLASMPSESATRSSSSISGTFTGKAKLKSGATGFGEVSSKEFNVAFHETLPLSAVADLGGGMTYGRTSFNFSSNAAPRPVPTRLQNLSLDLAYAERLNDSWSTAFSVNPGFRSAGRVFSSKSFGATATSVAVYHFNPTLTLAAGVGFDSLAAGRKFRGALAVDWNPNRSWRITLGVPKTAVTYAYSESLEFSVLAAGNFESYSVEKDPQPGATGKPSLQGTKLDYSDTRFGFTTTYKLTPALVLSGTVGRVADRQFDYHQRNFKLRSDERATYGSLSLAARF